MKDDETSKRLAELDQTVIELATAVESVVAAQLVRERAPEVAERLLRDAGALASAIRGNDPTPDVGEFDA